jgi:hypothetical protein
MLALSILSKKGGLDFHPSTFFFIEVVAKPSIGFKVKAG